MSLDSIYSYVHVNDSNQVIYLSKWQYLPIPFDDIDTDALFDAASNKFPQLLLEEDEEDAALPVNSSSRGAMAYKNDRTLRERVWTDLGLEKFTGHSTDDMVDRTMLQPLYTSHDESHREDSGFRSRATFRNSHNTNVPMAAIADFLSNGLAQDAVSTTFMSPDINDSSIYHGVDFSINSNDLSHNTFLNVRSSSHNHQAQNYNSHQFQPPPQPHHQQQSSHLQQQPLIQTPRIGRTRQASADRNFQTPITKIMR